MTLMWLGRAAGGRWGAARLLPLLLFGPGYLLFVQRSEPTAGDWAVTLAAGALFLLGGVRPLAVALGQAALVVAAQPVTDATPVTAKILASVALLELAVRRPPRAAVPAAVAVTLAYLVIIRDHGDAGVLGTGYRLVCVVAAPLLLGAYLRAASQALTQARARAREAEERRELAERGARQAERTELARELHDMVAHHVASMALRVGVARAVLPGIEPAVGEVLDDVHASATTTLADLRRLVGVLRDPAAVGDSAGSLLVEPAELPAAVAEVVDRSTQAGLTVDCRVDGDVAHLDAVRGLAVLRIVQEGLTNTVKHAGAGARARVSVRVRGGEAVIEVCDEGAAGGGAAEVPGGPGSGYGLIGLRERVALAGGTLEAGPHGGGWRLRAAFPVRPEAPPPAADPAPHTCSAWWPIRTAAGTP